MNNKDVEFGSLAMIIGGKIIQVISSPDKSTKAMFFLSDFEGNAQGAWSIE